MTMKSGMTLALTMNLLGAPAFRRRSQEVHGEGERESNSTENVEERQDALG